ncbi:MAG: hypothetical protein KDE59_03840 [Anaerolineales bacterium]|nr:hypothetical protein [Anaerolineales bacterium]
MIIVDRKIERSRGSLAISASFVGANLMEQKNDASHFNREHKRLFGLPPLRDVERLRAAVGFS